MPRELNAVPSIILNSRNSNSDSYSTSGLILETSLKIWLTCFWLVSFKMLGRDFMIWKASTPPLDKLSTVLLSNLDIFFSLIRWKALSRVSVAWLRSLKKPGFLFFAFSRIALSRAVNSAC